jgi:hypothetical protein
MNTGMLCERCCEEVAGAPPEIDWKSQFWYFAELSCASIGKILLALGQVIGFACFFMIAIWFHPIRALTPAEGRIRAAANRRRQQEEEDRARRDAAAEFDRERDAELRDRRISALVEANNNDVAIANSLLSSTNYADGRRGANDRYLANYNNGINTRLEAGTIDPEIALLDQMRNLQDAKRNILTEHMNDQERQRLLGVIGQLANEMDRLQRQPYEDPRRHELEAAYLREKVAEAQWKYDQLL